MAVAVVVGVGSHLQLPMSQELSVVPVSTTEVALFCSVAVAAADVVAGIAWQPSFASCVIDASMNSVVVVVAVDAAVVGVVEPSSHRLLVHS